MINIREMIAKKKNEFFVARDTDKLQAQKSALEAERKKLESERQLQADVKKEQQQIRELRSQPARERMNAFMGGLRKLKSAAQESNKRAEENRTRFEVGSPGPRNFELDNKGPFSKGGQLQASEMRSPFANDTFKTPKPAAPKEKRERGKTITIHLK